MYSLACVDEFKFPNSGGSDVYVLDVLRLASGAATTSSDQRLSLFNPTKLHSGPVSSFRTDHGNITCVEAFDWTNSTVCTAGENGSVSVWDLRMNAPQAEVARMTDNQTPITSLACSSAGCSVVAGTELEHHQASILIWDVRSTPTPKQQYKEVHSDDVTELNFHPNDPNILLSGSTDGLVNICDTRISDEDEVVIQAFNHGSVHHAAFLNDTEVFAVSHDERFSLYDMAEGYEKGAATTDYGDIRQILDCQYIANVFAKANGAGAVIGAGTHDQQTFQLVHLTRGGAGWTLDRENSVGLVGAHSSEIIRAFCFIDEMEMVLSAGEDGYIKAWRSGA